jgi:hypothetical protein
MRRTLLVAACALLFANGCDTGPTDPNRTLPLTGSLARSAATVSTFAMRHTGNLRATAVDLKQVAADGTTSAAARGITFSIGTATGTATCTATGSFGLIQGSVVSLGLTKGDYCVSLLEPTGVPEGSTLSYDIRLEITD